MNTCNTLNRFLLADLDEDASVHYILLKKKKEEKPHLCKPEIAQNPPPFVNIVKKVSGCGSVIVNEQRRTRPELGVTYVGLMSRCIMSCA